MEYKRDAVELVRAATGVACWWGIRFPVATARCRGRLVDPLVEPHPGQAQDRGDQADGDDQHDDAARGQTALVDRPGKLFSWPRTLARSPATTAKTATSMRAGQLTGGSAAQAAGELPHQLLGVDTELVEHSGIRVGVDLVGELGLGLGGLVVVATVLEHVDDLLLVDLHGDASFGCAYA
jgi:hypothetical protein